MIIEVKVPSPGESITEVQLSSWLVKDGEIIERDAEIAEVDSDKATLTINAPEQGKISLKIKEGDTVNVGTIVATIDTDAVGSGISSHDSKQTAATSADSVSPAISKPENTTLPEEVPAKEDASVYAAENNASVKTHITPLAKKMMEERNLSNEDVLQQLGGKRVSKADIESLPDKKTVKSVEQDKPASKKSSAEVPIQQVESTPETTQKSELQTSFSSDGNRSVERKKMSTLRLKLSQRLVSVKNETAMLTTFNEVNMSNIMAIKKKYNDKFKEKYGVSIGFMSIFTKAITLALKQFPQVNSIIDGDELIYHNYNDIGIAVSSPKGLVVPVVRNTELMSIAEIELKIKELAEKARNNKLSLEEMTGGTFTISNGGVFGSMLSTPILNPPQSAILGMHNIIDRPIALNGQVVIAPMMYVALSYDHRVIDGKDSVSFLVKVKELLENPSVMFYEGKDPVKGLLGIE
jgi:2-oxoglutarate dehydrogenase E2 component (dihydrolipoamide succinyltransferase)